SACTDQKVVNYIDNTVRVTFDLQAGFQDHSVRIDIDTAIYFQAILSAAVPFAGPIASFTTELTREQHHMAVVWGNGFPTTMIDTVTFTLAQSPQYFVGLRIQADTVWIKIQDRPFEYM
ncbi:MAG TPA: hypothetical protein VFF29_06565, partial [Bacteroidota bacterium]|nr:hypothetical protein [Bacteroidota bacterium]